ncbi:MAG: hypothetical protein KGM47_16990 [Acidobacteriota bacterium]|nr:hypothetical protein [Acidobacteriota bacterium]
MKIPSQPGYPITTFANGIPTNLAKNLTPNGTWQIVRILKPGGPTEGDFEILFEGSELDCDGFLQKQVKRDSPGLL